MRRPFSAEEYVSLKRPHQPAASADGAVCVYSVSEADFEESRMVSHLWLSDAEGEDNRRITFSHDGEEAPRFSPDGLWISFLSARPDFTRPEPELEEGEEPRLQLWLLPAAGGEARCLTDQREGVRDYDWLPDSSGLVYLAQEVRPKPLQAHRFNRHGEKNDAVAEHEDRRPVGVWRAEVEEDGENKRIWRGDPGVMSVSVSPEGKRAAFVTNYTGDPNDYARADLWILDLESGEPRRLTDRPGGEWDPRWSPDGDRILFAAALDPALSFSQGRLWIVPAEGGDLQPVLPDFDAEIEGAVWPRRTPQAIFFTAQEGLETALYRYEWEADAPERLIAETGVIGDFDVSEDGETVYLVRETGTEWADLYRLDLRPEAAPGEATEAESDDPNDAASAVADSQEPEREGKEPEAEEEKPYEPFARISDLNPDWREVELGPQRPYRWISDGEEIEGLLVLPARAPEGERLPLVVYVHGGPHSATQDVLSQGIPLQWLAQQGYAVLAPNYRGGSGYGAAFSVANYRDLGGGDFRDVMAGADALISDGAADPDRMAILGGSYGGYMTNWAISQTDRFRAAVSLFGIFNWITDYSNSEISHFEKEYFGRYYWEEPDLYLERSPFRFVKNIRTPVLIMHGESDANTFISNSREMYQALRALGRTASFVRYPREGHGFHEPRHRIDVLQRVTAWLDAYLKGDGPQQPAAYRLDQDVPGEEGWVLRVVDIAAVSPAGHEEPDDSIFAQVSFVLSTERKDAEIRLDLSAVRAEAEGEARPLLGAPLKTLDETVLIEGEGLRIAFKAKEAPAAFPAAAVFRVPKGPAEMRLIVPGFPAVTLPLPKPEKRTEDETKPEPEKVTREEEPVPTPGPAQKPRGG
jgi:dipeptidyl aminopeptidase/acylaminoacyl peptidase